MVQNGYLHAKLFDKAPTKEQAAFSSVLGISELSYVNVIKKLN
jgi:hypothetical protein